MKEEPNPPRLIRDPSLRPLLEREVARTISTARLAKNKAAITKAIASGAAATAIIGLKGIAALVLVGSAGTWYLLDREDEPAPRIEPLVEPPIAAPSEPKLEGEPKLHAPSKPTIEGQPRQAPRDPAIVGEPDDAPREPALRPKPKIRASDEPPPSPPPGPSELELQLARLRAAREALDRGAAAEALKLVEDFPDGAVSLDAALLGIDALVALDRKVDAIDAIERSLSHVSGPKKSELLRLQGDLSAAIGNCEKARAAYRRSLALDPDGASSEAARRGLDRCLDR